MLLAVRAFDIPLLELNEIAVKQNAKALAYIPRQLRTYELYKLAIEQDETLLDRLPNHVLSEFPELSKLAR